MRFHLIEQGYIISNKLTTTTAIYITKRLVPITDTFYLILNTLHKYKIGLYEAMEIDI